MTTSGVQAQLGAAVAGSVIVLPAGQYGANLSLRNRHGTPEKPIRIISADDGWISRGREPDFTWRVGPEGYAEGDEPPHLGGPPKPSLKDPALLVVADCSHVVIEGLKVRESWPSIFVIHDSHHLIIRDCALEGGTYAIFVRGPKTSHLLIERNRWTQDTTLDHRLWHAIKWVEAHGGEGGTGTARQFNGGFLSGKGIAGRVVVRDNTISDAYNGIRLKCEYVDRLAADGSFRNAHVHIHDNTFVRIRDNPLEPEGFAYDWHVRHNQLEDCHSWFSFDDVRGGYWYFYGNTGTFGTRQGLGPDGTGDLAQRHTIGRVLKLSYHSRVVRCGVPAGDMDGVPEFPWYVVHNSWRLRCPIVGGSNAVLPVDGEGPDFTAWATFANNAFEWPQMPEGREWLSTPMAPLHNVSFTLSYNMEFEGNLWTNWGPHDYAAGLPAGRGWERTGLRAPAPLFQQANGRWYTLAQGSPGLSSAAALQLKTPSGALVLARTNPDGRLHRGALQENGLISFPDLEKLARDLVSEIDRSGGASPST